MLILVVTEDWYLASHRLPLIRAARSAGWRVLAAVRVAQHAEPIRDAGATVVSLPMARESRHPWRELRTVAALRALYVRERPSVVHHVAWKPILYGSAAAYFSRRIGVLNAFAGLGHAYVEGPPPRRLERLLRPLLRRPRTLTLFQNADDAAMLEGRGVVPADRVRLIPGSGVDLARFHPVAPDPSAPPLVVLPARMLATKGVPEFVDAARRLRARHPSVRFALVGGDDPANPASLPEATLRAWVAESSVEWWGPRADMPDVLAQATIAVLPSHREGMPKSLLEAAAAGLPIVATDVPGCRDVVRDGDNGLLVPRGDAGALAGAIERLLDDPALARAMGRRGRERAEAEFGDARVGERTMALYEELMA